MKTLGGVLICQHSLRASAILATLR